MYQIRTDLALETQEKMQEDHVDLKGVRFLEEKVDKNITISTVVIETENAGVWQLNIKKSTYMSYKTCIFYVNFYVLLAVILCYCVL